MAGLGWKQWVRERLTAAQLQGYVQDQVIARAASASAYAAQNPAPAEGMHRHLDDSNRLEFHTGAAWAPRGARTIRRAHTPAVAYVPAGGGRESGVADGPVIAGFTTYETGAAVIVVSSRVSMAGPTGWFTHTIKVDGAVVGTGLVRSTLDEDRIFLGIVPSLAIGAHTIALRGDVSAGGNDGNWISSSIAIIGSVAE